MGLFDAANALDLAKVTEPATDAMVGDGAPPADLDSPSGSAGPVHDEAPPAQQSAETAFDTSATFDGLDISADIKPGLDAIGASLAQAGVSSHAVHHVADFLLAMKEAHDARENIGNVLPRHSYNVEQRFLVGQQPFVNWFLNSMNAAGASQSDVDGILNWYKSNEGKFAQANATAYREVERFDSQDRSRAQKSMKSEWGEEYTHNVRLINSYLDNLPAAERERIESGTVDGKRALNDPERLQELAKLARGGSETRADIEKLMANRYSKYWKGPDAARLQARYRDLVSGKS